MTGDRFHTGQSYGKAVAVGDNSIMFENKPESVQHRVSLEMLYRVFFFFLSFSSSGKFVP